MKTVNLELSKALKEAGYPQESDFWWYESPFGDGKWFLEYDITIYDPKVVSPTADEILDQLPSSIITEEGAYELGLEMRKVGKFYEVNYADIADVGNGGFHDLPGVDDKSLADAAAKMWLYLKKEGFLASQNH